MSGTVGKQYPAAEHFIAGLRAGSGRNWAESIAALNDSYRLNPLPITVFYLANSQMSALRWSDAVVTINELLRSKGKVLMDAPASLIPLSQLSLANCYEHLGDLTQAGELRATMNTLWKDADPELRARLN